MNSPRPTNHYTLALLTILLLLGVSGCLAPKAPMEIDAPRKFSATGRLRNLIVLPVEGRRGAQTEEHLIEMLEDTEVRGRPFFTIVEGRKLTNVENELARVRRGKIDRRELVRIREQTGAQGIYTGVITEALVKDSRYREDRPRCVEKENTWRGVMLGRCAEGMLEEQAVNCTKRNVRFTYVPRLLDVETGRPVFSDRYSRTATSRSCEGDGDSLTNADEMMEELIELVIADVQEDITPVITVVKLPMKKLEKKADASETQREEFESALAFAKADRLERACDTWRSLRREGIDTVAIRYNLALCEEYEGDLQGALTILKATDKMLMRPDHDVNQSLRRIHERIGANEEMTRIYRETMAGQASPGARAKPRSNATLKQVQLKLNARGYDCGTPDGLMGTKTRICIEQYQRKHRQTVTGRPTNRLAAELGITRPSSHPAQVKRN